jgi:hypothetical protein
MIMSSLNIKTLSSFFTVTSIAHSLEHWMKQCITDCGDFMNPYCVVLVLYKVVLPDVSNETSDILHKLVTHSLIHIPNTELTLL